MINLKHFFKNKKIFITGNTGFKGSWLSQILLNFGADVVGYSLEPNTNPSLFQALKLDKRMKTYYNDIRDFEKIKNALIAEKPDIVFHLAAQPIVRESYDDPLTTHTTNIIGTANILQAIKEIGTIKVAVMITTDKVYQNKEWIHPYRETDRLGGHDPYSASKACAELIIDSYRKSFFKDSNTLIGVVRAGNVIGGGDWAKDRIIPDIIRNILEKKQEIVLRNPNAIRPWQHVLEPLSGYILLAKKLFEEEKSFADAWNFAPDIENSISVQEIVKKSISILGEGSYSVTADNKKYETSLLTLDSTKAKIFLNWTPILNIEATLQFTIEWYKKYYDNDNIIEFTNNQISMYFNKKELN